MATIRTTELKARRRGQVMFSGKVVIGGTGAITSQDVMGCTVSRSSAGTYVLTFPEKWSSCDFASCMLKPTGGAASAQLRELQLIADAISTSKTLTFVNATVAAPTTPADPASGDVLYFQVILRMTSVK